MVTRGKSLVVLGWHSIEEDWFLSAAPGAIARRFEQQLRVLRKITSIVPLGWALQAMHNGRQLPPRALAITFDDGYRDTLTLAGPILRRLNIPGTCFLVPGILSGTVAPWWERLSWAFAHGRADAVEWGEQRLSLSTKAERRAAFSGIAGKLKRRDRGERDAAIDELVDALDPAERYSTSSRFLDWDGAQKLQKYMDIGSHSMYHAILGNETAQAQQADLADSRTQLSERLDADIRLLAYPNGTYSDYDRTTVDAAERAGYSYAITTERGLNNPQTPRYEVQRWMINPERGAVDLAKIPRDLALALRGK